MEQKEVFSACPVCGNTKFKVDLSVKDFSITQELFHLHRCTSCNFLFTANAPGEAHIGKYYASDVYISHTDGNKGFIEKLYQLVRKRTLAAKRSLITSYTKKDKGSILDYGCGTGAFLHEMKINGWTIQGIEPDAGARKKAEELTGETIQLPKDVSAFSMQSFDVITMWHVLEHVHALNETLGHLKSSLKEDGRIFIAVPNHASFDAIHYQAHWAAYDVPRHLYHFTPDTMKVLLQKHGLRIIVKKGMWFDSYYVSMLSEKYKSGSINYLKAFLIGLISNLRAFFNVDKCSSIIYVVAK